MAELPFETAEYLGKTLVRTIKKFFTKKKVIPAVFVDSDMQRFFKSFVEGTKLIMETNADGLLIDTYNKSIGKGLLDYCNIEEIALFVSECHNMKKGSMGCRFNKY